MIPSLFTALAGSLTPTQYNLVRIDSHKASIKSRLHRHFELKRMEVIGSASRNTAIKDHSDVDLLILLSRTEAMWGKQTISSNTFIKNIRDNLNDRYHQTVVRRDNQAIVLNFGNGERSIDVVPAIFSRIHQGSPVYWIADGDGGWMETSPSAHGRYLKDANNRSKDKLRRTTQFLKFWKHSRNTSFPLSSIYLELFLASNRICEGPKSYSQTILDTFTLLARQECRRLIDPVGVSGVFFASGSEYQWKTLNNAVESAREHAQKARNAEKIGNTQEAARQWGYVFNREFRMVSY